jgi:multicomponent K+:H+ antiporter subunit A
MFVIPGTVLPLILIIAVPFAIALLALVVAQRSVFLAGAIALLAPGAVVALGVPLWMEVSGGNERIVPIEFIPSLGIAANLRVDALGVFFVLLIGIIGLGIVQFSRYYLAEKATGGFWALLLAFMGAMLGIVLSDSLVLLFVFWEITTITSALLIGLDFGSAEARRGAIQAFLVTGLGGLALLAGIVLVAQIGGSFQLSELTLARETILADPLHVPALLLILLGAFTKSAQFPFHFWLPGAMAAPAPISAFLHSATMVKAGIFLLGRFFPIFHTSELWLPILSVVGLTTFFVGGWHAVRAYDLKQLLAHSTVAYLGVLTALYGFYARVGLQGELLNIMNHALYKSSLFLLIGWLEKAAGTRDLTLLESEKWVRREPVAATLFGIGALAMAGLPFLLGFMSKETFYSAVAGGPIEGLTLALAMATLASTLAVVYAGKLFVGTFWGWNPPDTERGYPRHKISPWLLIIPAILLVPQVVGGVVPGWFLGGILEPGQAWPEGLAVWQHLDVKLALSLGILVFGSVAYLKWKQLASIPIPPGPQRLSEGLMDGSLRHATWVSFALQRGGHPRFISIVLLFAIGSAFCGYFFWGAGGEVVPLIMGPDIGYVWVPTLVVCVAAVAAAVLHGRVVKVVLMAVVGYGMAVFYVMFRAPDLALTQLLVETISLLLLLLIFRRIPRPDQPWRPAVRRLAHVLVASISGLAMGFLAWSSGSYWVQQRSGYDQLALSVPEAAGYNVVNVILVDFRSVDTLGEAVVLGIAMLGAVALFETGRRRAVGGRRAPVPREDPSIRSLILTQIGHAALPVAVLFAVYLLLRGHNQPGGGFIAGLVTAAALVLQALSSGVEFTRRRLSFLIRPAFAIGLLLAIAAGVVAVGAGDEFLTHYHTYLTLPAGDYVHLSTTLLFDIGIYMVVVATAAVTLSVFARGVE